MYNSKCVYYKELLSFNYKKKTKTKDRHYMYNFSGRSLMVTSMFSCIYIYIYISDIGGLLIHGGGGTMFYKIIPFFG